MKISTIAIAGILMFATGINTSLAAGKENAEDSDGRNTETMEKAVIRVDPCFARSEKAAKSKECLTKSGRFDRIDLDARAKRREAKIKRMREAMAADSIEIKTKQDN